MKCPTCNMPVVAVCGYHAPDAPAGHQPKSYGTPGEHYITSHHCEGRVVVADATCGTIATADDLDAASVLVGGYWR